MKNGLMYAAMKLNPPNSIEVSSPLGVKTKLNFDGFPKGCVGFILVFDTPEAADEWSGNGHVTFEMAGERK